MDSLLASYASSDDEETSHKPTNQSLKFSLPPPKWKQEQSDSERNPKPASLFSRIPQPKSAKPHVPDSNISSFTKRVVQFRPPVNLDAMKYNNLDDDEEEEDERKRRKAELDARTPSVKSFLSSIPAPRNSVSLGVLGSGLGTGRRAVIDADVQGSNLGSENRESVAEVEVGVSGSEGRDSIGDYENCANFDIYSGYGGGDGNVEYSDGIAGAGDYTSNDNNEYGNYASYGQFPDNWSEGSSVGAPEVPIERALRLPAKRGRKDDPPQFIEVNQDELMKNRPREDQAKMTGIAFGPAYQPASSKGKPTKLHKRKHQIGALYFDMKQKETELAERRSKGFLTKAQTQGKYGW